MQNRNHTLHFTNFPHLFHTAFQSTPHHRCKCQELCRSLHLDRDWYRWLWFRRHGCKVEHFNKMQENNQFLTYAGTEVHSHSTVHQTGRFYCLIPAVCSLHHMCRSLQSCRLYWRDCVDRLWEYQGHHSWWLQYKRFWISEMTSQQKYIGAQTCKLLIMQKNENDNCHWP